MKLYTTSSKVNMPLTFAALVETVNTLTKEPLVKEIRIKNQRFFIDITKEAPMQPLDSIYSIPIIYDPLMPRSKYKLVYADGREEYYDIETTV